LAGFRARFGRGFDTGREASATTEAPNESDAADENAEGSSKRVELEDDGFDDNGFAEEEDANLLDLISSFGQHDVGPTSNTKKSGGKGK